MSNRQCANTIVKTLVVLFLMLTVFGIALASEGDGIIEPGEDSTEELARAVQNPVASLISVPFQNNTNFNFGPREKTQNAMNIQPVVPFSLSEKWNLITRTILPIISQPAFTLNQNRKDGVGGTLVYCIFFAKRFGKLDLWCRSGNSDSNLDG